MYPRVNKGPVEYTLDIEKALDGREKKSCVRFTFRTVEMFHHFAYRLAVEHAVQSGTISFAILGLDGFSSLMPGSGHAEARIEILDLAGEYEILVKKHGKQTHACTVIVTDDSVEVVPSPRNEGSFIHLETPKALYVP
ncbi:MAG: hypothetical protein QHI48_11375 [Bacteroidota bacterium]|nr:hypothetical protein [Bacteroidota bacterium]